ASQAWSSVYSGGTSISFPSTMSLVMTQVVRVLSCASRGFPHLRALQEVPAECLIARAMSFEVVETFQRLGNVRAMARVYPPHNEIRPVHPVEPLVALAVEPLVDGLPYVALESLDALPD